MITRPLNWLDLIDKYRVTHTWAPNFAYSLVCNALAVLRGSKIAAELGPVVRQRHVNGRRVGFADGHSALLDGAGFVRTAGDRDSTRFWYGRAGIGHHLRVATKDRPLKFHSVQRQLTPTGANPASPDAANARTFTSLGPPIPGVGIRIVNDEQEVVLENTVGHLQVRGTAVSPGYFRNPQANRVFRADGWFDSGDMGFLSEGELVITGRAKESIIIRGLNYACSEIEEAVNSVRGVEPSFTAACAVQHPGTGREELAVFFHTAADEERRLAEILREIRQCLVRQMGVRADFLLPVPNEAIPKTSIGKLQRGELSRRFAADEFKSVLARVAELQRRDNGPREAQRNPHNEIEKQVAAIWQEVLGLEHIGVHDNLFDLGGDSLLLTGMHTKLQEQFGPRITLVEMFNYPTIQALANFLSRSSDQGAGRHLGAADTPQAAGLGVARLRGCERRCGDRHGLPLSRRRQPPTILEKPMRRRGIDAVFLRRGSAGRRHRSQTRADPNYVKVSAVLPDIEWFDARFFGITPRCGPDGSAATCAPGMRLGGVEIAGYNPQTHPGSVGVYAGA